jgi:hypothetical protein
MKMGDRDKKFLDMFENVSKNNHENTKQTHTSGPLFLDMFENVSKNNHENTKQTHTSGPLFLDML